MSLRMHLMYLHCALLQSCRLKIQFSKFGHIIVRYKHMMKSNKALSEMNSRNKILQTEKLMNERGD